MKKKYLALFALVVSSLGVFFQSCTSSGKRNKAIDLRSLSSDTSVAPDSIAYLGSNNFVLYKNSEATDTVHFEKGTTYITNKGLAKANGKVYLNGKEIKADDQTMTWKEWRVQHTSHASHASHRAHASHYSNNK